jgi:SAM-dependent methyltransferase
VSGIIGSEEAARRVTHGFMHDLQAFPADSFDLVVALGIYHSASCQAEWDKALDETARVLVTEGTLLTANFTPQSDPTGTGLLPVTGEPHLYRGFDAGPTYLLHASELDAEMARRGLRPVRDTYTVDTATDSGHRVTANSLFRNQPVV